MRNLNGAFLALGATAVVAGVGLIHGSGSLGLSKSVASQKKAALVKNVRSLVTSIGQLDRRSTQEQHTDSEAIEFLFLEIRKALKGQRNPLLVAARKHASAYIRLWEKEGHDWDMGWSTLYAIREELRSWLD